MAEAPKIKVSPPDPANYAPARFRFILRAGEALASAAGAIVPAAMAEDVGLIRAVLDECRWAIEEAASQLSALLRETGGGDE
jgi:hypothetical protein